MVQLGYCSKHQSDSPHVLEFRPRHPGRFLPTFKFSLYERSTREAKVAATPTTKPLVTEHILHTALNLVLHMPHTYPRTGVAGMACKVR